MKATTTLLCLTLAGCTSSCGGASQNTPKPNWPRVVACTEPSPEDLLGVVQNVLARVDPEQGDTSAIGKQAVGELEAYATRYGEHVMACVINEAVASFERAAQPERPTAPPTTEPGVMSRGFEPAPAPAPAQEPSHAEPDDVEAKLAAERGRDFLQRVAKTHVQEAPAP